MQMPLPTFEMQKRIDRHLTSSVFVECFVMSMQATSLAAS